MSEATEEKTTEKPKSKMQMVREIITESPDMMPADIVIAIKEKFGATMTTAHVSNYKTAILRKKPSKKGGKKAPKLAVPKNRVAKAFSANGKAGKKHKEVEHELPEDESGSISFADIAAVKMLKSKFGKGILLKLVDLLVE